MTTKLLLTIPIAFFALGLISCPAADYAPVKGWRVIPDVANDSYGSRIFRTELLAGKDASWEPEKPSQSKNGPEWFAWRLRDRGKYLVTFRCEQGTTPVYAVLERSTNSSTGNDGDWKQEAVVLPKAKLDKFVFDSPASTWWRVRWAFRRSVEPSAFKVTDIGLYRLDIPGRKDYWLTIGASIQAQSIRNSVFKAMVRERYPGYDPVMFNLAVGGWRSDHLLKALPGFLKAHPYASYVCIHIGGNNVSQKRPYPGGAEELKADLVAILEMIKASGKIPILSRLSYRAYKGDKPVPPEENGSGPYVTNIYDPLIKQYCQDFFDAESGKGIVDAYGWFKEHPEELSADGIHVNPKGAESWNRLWAEKAGSVIYTGRQSAP